MRGAGTLTFFVVLLLSCASAQNVPGVSYHPVQEHVVTVCHEIGGEMCYGHGVIVGKDCVMTLEHLAPDGSTVWVETGMGFCIDVEDAERIFVVESEDLILLYLDVSGMLFSGFFGESVLDEFGDGPMELVVTEHGAITDASDVQAGDSGSPVLNDEGDVVALLSGTREGSSGKKSFWITEPPDGWRR